MRRRPLLPTLVLAAVASLAATSLALAHAELETATPGPDDIVTVAPTELVATFTEALDGSKSSIEIRDASGAVVASGGADDVAADGITMTLPLPALRNGVYEVRWTSAALDGHIERGTYQFTVAVSASPSPSPSRQAPASANPTSRPSASATSSPTRSPSPGDGDTGTGDAGDVDAATLVPIGAALVVVAALAIYFIRSRRG